MRPLSSCMLLPVAFFAANSCAFIPNPSLRFPEKLLKSDRWKPLRSTNEKSYDGLKEDLQHKLKHEGVFDRDEENHAPSQEANTKTPSWMLHFIRSFWRGMSLPFPVLRNVVLPQAFRQIKFGRAADSSTFTVGLSFREALYALFVYLFVGVTAYSVVLEKWSVIDSLYFTCTCFSTVGYGDLCPTNAASKFFTCAFGIIGISFLGAAVAAVGGKIAEAEVEAARNARRESSKAIMHLFEGMPKVLHLFRRDKSEEEQRKELLEKAKAAREDLQRKFQENFRHRIEPRYSSIEKMLSSAIIRSIPSLVVLFLGGIIMQILNGRVWSWGDSLYYSLVTATTIGFGDLCPKTPAARLFAVLFIPLSVAAMGELLSGIAMELVHRRQRELYERQLQQELTIDHLKVMDFDKNGQISREEYVRFMLLEMGRVTPQEIDELYMQFDRLDVTASGYLDNEDLELMAKLRGATVKGANNNHV